MQATVQTVSSESKVTKSGKTYYKIQADGNWLSVFQKFNVGDVIEYEEGNLPGWPRGVHLVGGEHAKSTERHVGNSFGRVEFAQLLEAVAGIAIAAGITDHQAITALNNTLLIALQKQGTKIDIGSFIGAPF